MSLESCPAILSPAKFLQKQQKRQLLILSLATFYFEVSTSVEEFCVPLWKGWKAAAGSLGREGWVLPLGRALTAEVRLHLSVGWRQAVVDTGRAV